MWLTLPEHPIGSSFPVAGFRRCRFQFVPGLPLHDAATAEAACALVAASP